MKLPVPDEYGNYWLAKNKRDKAVSAVIFPSRVKACKFFVSLGSSPNWDMAYCHEGLRYFNSAQEALDFVEKVGVLA